MEYLGTLAVLSMFGLKVAKSAIKKNVLQKTPYGYQKRKT
jgi:hypothetical protein